ncbi:MAG: right-handed parallel beta-helix repeat-containing protein [Verrucomicrobiota bacterium]
MNPCVVFCPGPRPASRSRLKLAALFAAGSLALSAPAAQFYNDWAATHISNPSSRGSLADPDQDGEVNAVEFVFGTDPVVANSGSLLTPLSGPSSGTNGEFTVSVLEREGHQPGAQLDLYLSSDLRQWFRPWWLRAVTNSWAGDPAGSVREVFTTRLPGTNIWFVRAAVTVFEPGPEAAAYYVATNGSDSNAGTSIAAPFATPAKAIGLAVPGDLIYLRGGIYSCTNKISISSRGGTPSQPIRVRSYPGEQPVLDFTWQAAGNDGISISTNCWQFYGIEITNAGHNALKVTGSSNRFERCVFHHCRDSGFNIGSSSATVLASYNVVVNCDAYRNYDTGAHGGNADGFAAKWMVGPGTVFTGCRSWENSDDGWDLWMAVSPILITNCWTFRNGSNYFGDSAFAGNGNGFKLGGNYIPAAHRIVHCLSFNNVGTGTGGGKGFDQNNNTAGLTVDQCSGWKNRMYNFNLWTATVTQGVTVLRNNYSVDGAVWYTNSSVQLGNSWLVLGSTSTGDVLSSDVNFAQAARRDDGGLPETPFFRPVPGGQLVDRGSDYGDPYSGGAPDIGAFETPAWF